MLGNLGVTEILVIGGVVLLIFGPKRLPELAKGLGKGIRDFKKALNEPDEKDSSSDDPKNHSKS
ncbi:MAG: twin-arginine translocase TatA/TatE family subunit [Pseudomonadota bacterium]